jgi:hypothetical protein
MSNPQMLILGSIYDPDLDCWYVVGRMSSEEHERWVLKSERGVEE